LKICSFNFSKLQIRYSSFYDRNGGGRVNEKIFIFVLENIKTVSSSLQEDDLEKYGTCTNT